MWDLPGPGLEPESPALAGGFFTTAPPSPKPVFLENHLSKCDQLLISSSSFTLTESQKAAAMREPL